ncbi:MAG: Epoxyqueuosine reductase [Synergistetes bacterium ADurb.BinA166]|nr:MAG: Epoxyqueuosine reductase [Synergistetes bacterium ADurb.BinA166]
MNYLTRHATLREQPELLLPGVKTILVAALRHAPTASPGYAAYAAGADYHAVIRTRLQPLADLIRSRAPEARTRIAVDSAPVAERDWAMRCGIGWRGRQGQVLNAEAGAHLLLGEILTTVELPPTPPVENRCGECRLCVDACPTGALQADGTVDARLCRSYWTIEHRGPIPESVRASIGDCLFGCDRCVSICPWNARATAPIPPEFTPRDLPPVEVCLTLDAAGFTERFGDSAVLRTGLDGLQRNARIVMDNQRPTPP